MDIVLSVLMQERERTWRGGRKTEGEREGEREGEGGRGGESEIQRSDGRKEGRERETERRTERERWGDVHAHVPITCSLGPLQAVAVAALILSTTYTRHAITYTVSIPSIHEQAPELIQGQFHCPKPQKSGHLTN